MEKMTKKCTPAKMDLEKNINSVLNQQVKTRFEILGVKSKDCYVRLTHLGVKYLPTPGVGADILAFNQREVDKVKGQSGTCVLTKKKAKAFFHDAQTIDMMAINLSSYGTQCTGALVWKP